MEAPPGGMSVEEFNTFLKGEIESRYVKAEVPGGGYRWLCKMCGSVIQQTTCCVSKHESAFGNQHAGDGEIERIALPYCPQCEGEPQNTSTCVHMRLIPL